MVKKNNKNDLFDKNEKKISTYTEYYNDIIVREQPFYRCGMSEEEKKAEEEYLNNNLEAFYEGKYTPLWKQAWFK